MIECRCDACQTPSDDPAPEWDRDHIGEVPDWIWNRCVMCQICECGDTPGDPGKCETVISWNDPRPCQCRHPVWKSKSE